MIAFTKEQERFREQMKDAMGGIGKSPMDMMKMTPMKAIEEQARRNIELFQNAMRMFTPFPPAGEQQVAATDEDRDAPADQDDGDLQDLKEQIAAMQRRLDKMGKG
jgi:polyhydroxyalkanoate synthesis regulator protein